MKLYHATSAESAKSIIGNGFPPLLCGFDNFEAAARHAINHCNGPLAVVSFEVDEAVKSGEVFYTLHEPENLKIEWLKFI